METTQNEQNAVAIKKDIGSQVITRIDNLCQEGFTMPSDFNYVNAVKATMLTLQEVVDRNKRPALEVCTPASVQTALFQMCTSGLDVSKKQAYLIVRGNKLTLNVSYFGHILQVRRIYPKWTPVAHTIRQGDVFEYGIEPETGKMKLVKHEQKLENLDNEFVGAYMYLPCADGTQELYVMTRKQILAAWAKSSNQSLTTHKQFDEKMCLKTIINSGCQKVINSTPEIITSANETNEPSDFENPIKKDEQEFVEFDEVDEQNTDATPKDTSDTSADTTADIPEDYKI